VQGLQVADYSGHFCRRIPTDVDLPAVDCDKAVLVTLRHEEKLPETQEAAFQCALLYTTLTGQRRIRVHTLSLPVTTALGNLFRGADLDAHFAYFLKTGARAARPAGAGTDAARR
jgi:protein transport protein SEC24